MSRDEEQGVDWRKLGESEDGLPVHLPMPVNAKGQGPERESRAVGMRCWCGERCLLDRALQEAVLAGMRRALREVDL